MSGLPSGAVTFLFSDIEGSTQLVKALRDRYAEVLADHRRLVRTAIAAHAGHEVDTQGDAFFAAFGGATQAVLCALDIQRALAAHPWPGGAQVRVRIGVHTGQAVPTEGAYTGLAVHRAARICAAANGGQVLISQATQTLIEDEEEAELGFTLTDVGEHRLKDLDRPVRLFQLTAAGLDLASPPTSAGAGVHGWPSALTSFIGRTGPVREVAGLLAEHRLVTVTGPGGSGKTRLAGEVARQMAGRFADGAWATELAPVVDPAALASVVAAALGVRDLPGASAAEALARVLARRQLLLVLDNCEHVIGAAAELCAGLLAAADEVTILATSREPLAVAGEARYRLDHTPAMEALPLPSAVDGYVFKAKSPSCGVRAVPRYRSGGQACGIVGPGLYADRVMAEFPLLAVEDEGRLSDAGLREAFMERVFAAARLRSLLSGREEPRDLVAFHARHKLQLLAHDPVRYRSAGRVVAAAGAVSLAETAAAYRELFLAAMAGRATRGRNANALLHAYSRIGRALTPPRRGDLVARIEAYRRGEVPLTVPVVLLAHYASDGDLPWLAEQTYLAPFPAGLRLRASLP